LIDKVTGSAFKRISTIATYEERKSINGKWNVKRNQKWERITRGGLNVAGACTSKSLARSCCPKEPGCWFNITANIDRRFVPARPGYHYDDARTSPTSLAPSPSRWPGVREKWNCCSRRPRGIASVRGSRPYFSVCCTLSPVCLMHAGTTRPARKTKIIARGWQDCFSFSVYMHVLNIGVWKFSFLVCALCLFRNCET
jgi:hypothetical protein